MDKIRGVNLGGWFVLEKWMKPALFEGVSGPDETVFCLESPNAKEKLETHWQTFITEDDFNYLHQLGINSVRIPIPWWAFIEQEPYHSALPYIKQAMNWASKYKLNVLLDLHTAPGSQNGFDNGGITGIIDWPTDIANIKTTLDVIQKVVEHFKDEEALWGIEVLNEPHWTIDMDLLQDYYLKAYTIIRKELPKTMVVFHDAFRPLNTSWHEFFTTNDLDYVAFDLHLYHCFEDKFNDMPAPGHIEETFRRQLELIQPLQSFVPVIVGEWSLGLHNHLFAGMDPLNQQLVERAIASSQMLAYEQGLGWYFWSYKIEQDSHLGWDFKRLVEQGILPKQYK